MKIEELEIVDDIEVPPEEGSLIGVFRDMEPGQSFICARDMQNLLSVYQSRVQAEYPGRKYTVRMRNEADHNEEGCRVWRVT